jgi:hypothetical protein
MLVNKLSNHFTTSRFPDLCLHHLQKNEKKREEYYRNHRPRKMQKEYDLSSSFRARGIMTIKEQEGVLVYFLLVQYLNQQTVLK